MVSDKVVVRVIEPEVAVIVTVAAPRVAVLEAENVAVTELPVVALEGLKATVTPLGNPEALIDTAPVKLDRLMAMTELPLPPRATLSGAGLPNVKSPVPVTVKDTEVVRVTLPDVAVIVTAAVPSVAELDAENVAVTELPVVADDGLKATVTPLGNPDALIDTAPVKLVREIAITELPLPPRATDRVAGDEDTV
jgi:hypothetical protein